MPSTSKAATKWVVAMLAIVLSLAVVWAVRHRQPGGEQDRRATGATPGASPVPTTLSTAPSPSATPAEIAASPTPSTMASGFQARPLAVARESQNYQWTAEDAKRPEIIHKLAHNEMEEQRMLAENPRIKRRQLVYVKQPVAALMEQSKLTGEKLQTLSLPALDGQELPFEITGADLEPSGQIGTFTGHLAGRPQSSVSLAYRFGRQAFTVLSPEDGNNFEAEPREPGQMVVKSIDPDTYSPLPDTVIYKKRQLPPAPSPGKTP